MAFVFEYLLLDVAAFTACLFLAIYLYFKHAYTYWKKRNVQCMEPSFPFGSFADIVLFRTSIGEFYENLYKKLKGEKYAGTYMFTKPGFIFFDPELIKSVLVKDFSHFHDRSIYVNEEVEPLAGHLLLLKGQRWRNLRVKLTPTFTSGKMKMMFQTLVDSGLELQSCVEKMSNSAETIEVKDVLARYSTDIISSCAFGIQCNSLKNPDAEFREWGRKIFALTVKSAIARLLAITVPKIMDILKINVLDGKVSKYFRQMVRETIEYREKNNFKRNDFLQLLIQLKNNGYVAPEDSNESGDTMNEITTTGNTNNLTVDNLAAQAFVFFFAGFETSSTTMTFCLYEMSLHPEIQERAREEVRTVLSKHDDKITYDSIQEMEYLDKVVSETLRKYPPLPFLNRECTKDYKVPESDVVLKKGVPVIIPILAIHHDPKYYPDPEKFDPERFNEEEKQKRHHFVYLPFGEGPRVCIGNRFGLMQTKVGLASLLSKFQFEVGEKTPIPLEFDKRSLILAPTGGMWLNIKKCQ